MAKISAFRGVRYDVARLDAGDLVCPPYDVISDQQARHYRQRSPYNAVHLELPQPTAAHDDRYEAAAALLREWLASGILRRDREPSLYLLEQAFRGPDGQQRRRRGLLALLRLEDFSTRVVLPHEKTHTGPKEDRLRLLRATRANVSPIFMLYSDPTDEVGAALAAAEPPPAQPMTVTDEDGTVHRCTQLSGSVVDQVISALAAKRLYIADGHHRYETALHYRDERRAVGDHSADETLVYLSSMDDPGLVVFPTHRLLKAVSLPSPQDVLARLAPTFAVFLERPDGTSGCRAMMSHMGSLSDSTKVFGLYFPRERTCATVELRDPSAIARLVAEGMSPDLAHLPVTLLHSLILGDALGLGPAQTEGKIDYVAGFDEALALLETDSQYTLGVFLNPMPVADVRHVADRGETMPHKSTYFYPKPLTGLVFHVASAVDETLPAHSSSPVVPKGHA